MNVQTYLPSLKGKAPLLDFKALETMMSLRSTTFRGFAAVEQRNGLLTLDQPLSDSQSQDSLRMLVYRFIEELFESMAADSREHVLEEAIDAINYLWALALIEAPYAPEGISGFHSRVIHALVENFQAWEALTSLDNLETPSKLDPSAVMGIITPIFSELSPKLRNRAWMHETQQTDFAYRELIFVIAEGTQIILSIFVDWNEFWEFFMAKDAVLQFRLATKY